RPERKRQVSDARHTISHGGELSIMRRGTVSVGLRPWTALVVACAMFHLTGCSISESVKSSSDIISSPSKSSKSSSHGDEYRNDVRDFTATYLKSGGNPEKLEAEISAVAEKRGVT